MNVLIEGWKKELLNLSKRENILRDAIKAAQEACPHTNMAETSYDSHKTYYTCTECGHESYC